MIVDGDILHFHSETKLAESRSTPAMSAKKNPVKMADNCLRESTNTTTGQLATAIARLTCKSLDTDERPKRNNL